MYFLVLFFFNDSAPTEIYTLSLHDALPIFEVVKGGLILDLGVRGFLPASLVDIRRVHNLDEFMSQKLECKVIERSEEHTSELQSLAYLVCRLLLEKKKVEM